MHSKNYLTWPNFGVVKQNKEQRMMKLNEQVKNIASDLVNIEVNTIVSSHITGKKMPKPRHALIDIGKDYHIKLGSICVNLNGLIRDRLGSRAAFDGFREHAKKEIEARTRTWNQLTAEQKLQQEADLLMLHRIKDMSDQIKGIFDDLKARGEKEWDNDYSRSQIQEKRPEFRITPDQLTVIRKIWEIGTEEIAMQTIIQLDGDVVTRVKPSFTRKEDEVLHKIHSEGVSTSVNFWKTLIGIVNDLLKSLFRLISPV